jgi:NADPH-dependent 2,4-dienoyl-CoA reductase/sulfur reductase-like enzyme
MMNYKYVILGGGLAAGYAAQEFVAHGIQAGELCILSAEGTLPYERPPLSKDYLAGEKNVADILINEPSFYEEHGITVKLETPVTGVDLDARQLETSDGPVHYEKLLITTGASPRTLELPGADLENIFYLRQVTDARRIRQQARQAEKAVVIGGSFIGMEAASVLQSAGVETTMVFPEERVWQSFFTPEMSAFFEQYYRERGVKLLPQAEVAAFGGNGRLTEVITRSGQSIAADMVVAGIGVIPNSQLFSSTPLKTKDGCLLVNCYLETNMPNVAAAGDITCFEDVVFDKATAHVEHWDNAVQQGQHAARTLLGQRQPYAYVPYFFSDVFDLSYEFWGDAAEAVETVTRGDVANGRFSVWWLGENGRLLAAFIMDRPDEEREAAPQWIKEGQQLSAKWLQETDSLTPQEKSVDGA